MSVSKKKVAAVLGAGAMAVAGSGVAYAYWTTSGSGTGTATTATGVVNTLGFVTTDLDPMFPGDLSQTLSVAVTNSDEQSVYVSTVKAWLSVAKATVNTPAGTCDATDYLLNGANTANSLANAQTLTWTAQELAKNATANATGSIQFNDKNGDAAADQSGCKGAVVTIHYSAS